VLGIFGGVELADPLKIELIMIGLIIFFVGYESCESLKIVLNLYIYIYIYIHTYRVRHQNSDKSNNFSKRIFY